MLKWLAPLLLLALGCGALADPIDRSELFVKDGDTVIKGALGIRSR